MSLDNNKKSVTIPATPYYIILGKSYIIPPIPAPAGAAAGASWEKIPGVVDKYSSIIALGIAVLFTIGSWKFMKKRLKDEEE